MASSLPPNPPPNTASVNVPSINMEDQSRQSTVFLATLSDETSQNRTQPSAPMTAVKPDLQREVDTIKSMAGSVLHVLVKQDQEIKEQRREIQQLQQKVRDLENQNKEILSQARNVQIFYEKDVLRISIFFTESRLLFAVGSILDALAAPVAAHFTMGRSKNRAIQNEPTAAELLEYMEKKPGTTREEALRALLVAKLKRAGENSFFPTENDIQNAINQSPDSQGKFREEAIRLLVNQHIERLKEKTGKKD